MNDPSTGGQVDAGLIIRKFQERLSDTMTNLIVLESRLEEKQAEIDELRAQLSAPDENQE